MSGNPGNKGPAFCKRPWKAMTVAIALFYFWTIIWAFHVSGDRANRDISSVTKVWPFGKLSSVGKNVALARHFPQSAVISVSGASAGNGNQAPLPVGSAFIVDPSGYAITAHNIIKPYPDLVAVFQSATGPKQYDAQIVKVAPEHNLALIKIISVERFPFLSFEDHAQVSLSQGVFAVSGYGNAGTALRPGTILDVSGSVNVGKEIYSNMIISDAVNSWEQTGGPLVNTYGSVIGMNVAIVRPGGALTGFTIPSSIIATHFQDIANIQFGVDLQPPGGLAQSVAPPPPPFQTPLGEPETGRNAAFRSPLDAGVAGTAPSTSARGGWWEMARNYVNQQGANTSPYPAAIGLNVAGTLPVQSQAAVDVEHSPGTTLWGFSFKSVIGLLALGFISGVSGGMMTMGGGVIKVTGLILVFGYGMLLIRPVAYITNIFIYGAASLRYNRASLISWDHVTPLVPWAILGVIIGYFAGNYLDATTVRHILGVFAFLVAVQILNDIVSGASARDGGDGAESAGGETGDGDAPWSRTLQAMLALPMGVVSGILGISGGVIEVPLQQYLGKQPLKTAIANSAVLVFMSSLVCSVVSVIHGVSIGEFNWTVPLTLAAIITPGAYVGGMVGSWLTKVVPVNVLRWIYTGLMLLISFRMLIQ
ncbi:MAG: TSUP family transporter [Nitrospinae bacterium]|nr:TSUP family transporter [Nitrospinota bacterium]